MLCFQFIWGNKNNVSNDRKGIDLLNILDETNYRIIKPDEPTLFPYRGSPSTVDFVVVKSFNHVSKIDVLNDLSSDHLPLLFSIEGSSSFLDFEDPINLSKVNWKKFSSLVISQCHSIDSSQLNSHNLINSAVS